VGDPIRVLQAVVNMNRGGAETFLMNLYRNIDRSKVQFDFLTSRPGVFDDEIKELGGRIYRIPYISDTGHFSYLRALDRFFAEHSAFSAIHAHMDRMSGLVLRSARKYGIPVRIAHSHNTKSEGGTASRVYKWLAGANIAKAATHYAACSHAAGKWLFGGRSGKAVIWPNGIDTEHFAFQPDVRSAVRNELGLDDHQLVVGHVGRFAPQKNHLGLLDIFAELVKARPDSMLLLAGDGALRTAIEERIQSLHLADKVKLLGVCPQIDRLLQAFDAMLFPSLHEGLPVTLIEAQGAGLPCIISDAITDEVDLGIGLVHRLPLSEPARFVRKLAEIDPESSSGRAIPSGSLAGRGYDIKHTAKLLADYYVSPFEVRDEPVNRIYANL